MKSIILRSGLAALACATVLAIASPSMAAMVNFKASLSGKTEVPPNTSAATGSVTATYDDASKKLTWKGNLSGLSGPATAAHFHAGETGKNGAVVIPITGADLAELRALLEHAYRKALERQRVGGDQATDAAAGDQEGGGATVCAGHGISSIGIKEIVSRAT